MGKNIASYVYEAGFVHAAWADTILNIGSFPPFRLHALFAARSPVLYNFLTTQNLPHRIDLNPEDLNLTPVAISMALATLYGQPLDVRGVDIPLAKGLIAAGSLLGMGHVAESGVKGLLANLSKENVGELLTFALSLPPQNFPNEIASKIDLDIFYPGPYPLYTKTLVKYLVDFILLNFNASELPLDPHFEAILLDLPFLLLKYICESDKLIVNGHMGRHQFACEVAASRQRELRKNVQPDQDGPLLEENAVLSFSNGKGKVELIRRPVSRRKVLWKAGKN